MPKLNQQGAAHLLVPLILLAGIAVGVYLITTGNLKLFSKASNPPIVFKNVDGSALPLNKKGIPYIPSTSANVGVGTTYPQVKVELTSTLGPPTSVSAPNNKNTVAYRTAYNPTNLNTQAFLPYQVEPTVYNMQFLENTLGLHFFWVEFKDSRGNTDRRSAQIEVVTVTTPGATHPPRPGDCNACAADINKDNQVNGRDASLLFRCFHQQATGRCAIADVNGDGKVNFGDFGCVKTQFGKTCATGGPTPTPIPTPPPFPTPSSATSLSVSPTTLNSNETLNVTWSGIQNPNLGDYININTADDKNGVTSHTYWINNNCSWFKPSSGTPKSSGSCTISLKNDAINTAFPGPYHLVLASGTTPGTNTVLAKSNNFDLIKRVFVTSTTYNGNLVRSDFPLTGLSGADDKCRERAFAANLGSNWKAWLADSNTSVSSRLTHNSGPYKLLDGTTIANNWSDLTDGTLQNPINLTELKTTPNYMSCVWTSTNIDGNYLPAQANVTACNNYTSANSDYSWCGRNGSSNSEWTKWSTDRCDQQHPLYCFEQ